jgi:hypothetical protein
MLMFVSSILTGLAENPKASTHGGCPVGSQELYKNITIVCVVVTNG